MTQIVRFATVNIVILFLFISDRQCIGLQCYVGTGHKNSNSSDTTSVDCSSKAKSIGDSSPNCFLFYNPIADEAVYGCDEEDICTVSRGTQTNSVCYKQRRGSLMCCQSDHCNDQSYLFHLSPPQSATICYSGTNNGTPVVSEVKCLTSWCYHDVVRSSGGHIINQTFGCDSECDSSKPPPSIVSCRDYTTPDGYNRRTCICSTDRCNSQISIIDPNPAPKSTTPAPPHLSMHNPDIDHTSSSLLRILVPTCVGLIALLFLALIAIVVIRYHDHRAKAVSFTYTQLTADLAEEPAEVDDDGLLIG